MKISEAIQELAALQEKYGDLVIVNDNDLPAAFEFNDDSFPAIVVA